MREGEGLGMLRRHEVTVIVTTSKDEDQSCQAQAAQAAQAAQGPSHTGQDSTDKTGQRTPVT